MRLLLDTHVILWVSHSPSRLSATARELISDPQNDVFFSVVSLWEIAIKFGLGRADYEVDPVALRQALDANGFVELPLTGAHAIAVKGLPSLHRDPFDRLLIAQSFVEGLILVTGDAEVARYPAAIRRV